CDSATLVLLSWRRPASTLFPYTTLFRSGVLHFKKRLPLLDRSIGNNDVDLSERLFDLVRSLSQRGDVANIGSNALGSPSISTDRSEEHTSELQSRGQLVCRLLLEKKKTT